MNETGFLKALFLSYWLLCVCFYIYVKCDQKP